LSANLEFLSRPGCHLCEQALPAVKRVASRLGVELVEVDVDADDRLVAEFGLRIPVVRWENGPVLAEGRIDRRELLAAARNAIGAR